MLPFGQTFELSDLAVIGLLVVLEGVLSIDNALVLGLLAKRLPPRQRGRALTYGLVGAFVFRFVSIFTAQLLLRWTIVKLIGGGYLLYVALKHFLFESKSEDSQKIAIGPDGHPIVDGADAPATKDGNGEGKGAGGVAYAAFWPTVFVIEATDIAFAIDSILAAIALVGPNPQSEGAHPKLWVVVTGGMLGVILMRYAAVVFIKLLERFPRFEVSAYLLVCVIGLKLVVDWFAHTPYCESWGDWVDFHSPRSPAFWTFWLLMLVCLGYGFLPKKKDASSTPSATA
jgi:YkoY family integral membrane protein